MNRSLKEEKIVWNTMKSLYKLLASHDGQKIIDVLLDQKEMKSTDLMNKADLTESQFHPTLRQLVKYNILERTVNQDRTVSYEISPFGKNVLDLSKPMLKAIRKSLPEEPIVVN